MCRHGDPRCEEDAGSVLSHVCSACLDDVARTEDGDLRYRAELTCMCQVCNPRGLIPPRMRPLPVIHDDFEDEPFPFRVDE